MQFNFTISSNGWELPDSLWSEIKVTGQDAMAVRLSDIVLENFGVSGINRPEEWDNLKERYAKEYHGGDTTPTLVLTNELRSSINVELGNEEHSSVYTDCPYAADQQYGDPKRNLPARPFFPIDESGELTPFALEQVVEAAETAIAEKLLNLD